MSARSDAYAPGRAELEGRASQRRNARKPGQRTPEPKTPAGMIDGARLDNPLEEDHDRELARIDRMAERSGLTTAQVLAAMRRR